MATDLKLVKAFEIELDSAFAALPIFKADANESLAFVCKLCEMSHENPAYLGLTGVFGRGADLFARHLVSGANGDETEVSSVTNDLVFAAHYHDLRDYLYFAYNVPESIEWQWSADRVELRFADSSIPRQFYTEFNNWMIDSRDLFEDFDSRPIRNLLRGEQEFTESENVRKAHDLIEEEAELKLAAYFSVLDREAEIDFGGYSYKQFMILYRALLVKALYHRHFQAANRGDGGPVCIFPRELVDAAKVDMPPECALSILRDLVFDAGAARTRTDPSYFSLLCEGREPGRIWMRPHEFSLGDGLVDHLRVVAHRRSELFLNNVSGPLGAGFAKKVADAFQAQGFICLPNISLQKFDSQLPDIDLLVISEEPTFGFVLFICELKGMIPAGWAKDRLRALREGGVAKAFVQLEKINSFLSTKAGIELISKLIPAEQLSKFDGFLVAFRFLVVTSDNAGMFFGDKSVKVLNYRMLQRLLKRADGDTAYILDVLSGYDRQVDALLKRAMVECKIGGRTVSYEGVAESPMLDFPARKWRNSAERRQMIEDFFASGGHPFDTLNALGPTAETPEVP